MTELEQRAEAWVDAFVERHIRTRVLDGRPDRVFVRTLKAEIAELLAEVSRVPETPEPAKRGRPRKDAN